MLFICTAILFLVGTIVAQPIEEWTRTFGGTGLGYSVQQTTDGGYIIAGITEGSYRDSDIFLIKTDPKGNEKWSWSFGGADEDLASAVQQTKDGGYILAGATASYGAGGYDILLVKIDSNGNEEWNKTFGGVENEMGMVALQTKDGGFIIIKVGYVGANDFGGWMMKTDSQGNEQRSKGFGGEIVRGETGSHTIRQTMEGGYIVGTNSGIAKIDSNGNTEWGKSLGQIWDRVYFFLYSIDQASDGGYVMTVITDTHEIGLVKTDLNGNMEWNKTFGELNRDIIRFPVLQTKDGGYIMASGKASDAGDIEVWLIKTDSRGKEEWNETYGGSADEFGWAIQQTKDGGYIITGGSSDGTLLMKLKPASPIWISKRPTKTPEEKPEAPTEEEKGIPGFEVVFAIAGLLAVAYILRRRK